jgi:HNH endonuclease
MNLPASFPIAHIGGLASILMDDNDLTAVIHGYGLWHCECESSDQAYELRNAIQAAFNSHEDN